MPVDNSYEVGLATKMQFVLDQPMSDITTKLVNHDYEGDFFKIGDTVSIVKPDPTSVVVQMSDVNDAIDPDAKPAPVQDKASNLDTRVKTKELDFSKITMRIDKAMKYGFYISDVSVAEGAFNYESGAHELAAREMRKKHNLDICDLIANDGNIPRIGTPAAPIAIDTDKVYTDLAVPIYSTLYNNGAIDADAQYTFGGNQTEQKRTAAGFFCPQEVFQLLLASKWLTDRSTTAADDKVATANIKQLLGMDVMVEPALSQNSATHVTVDSIKDNSTYVVIAGTANCVTKAGKVLKPDKLRSTTRHGYGYYGLEIFGRKVAQPKAAVVAFVEIGAVAA